MNEPSPRLGGADQRWRSFRRMRALASLSLLLMTAVFLACWHWRAAHPALPYLQAFAEAAMIGGLADWFAIVALFRRPFGLPIPHTAIIPANKARIGRSLGDFLGHYLLDADSLTALLRNLELAPHLGRWLQAEDHADRLAAWLAAQGPAVAAELPLAPLLAEAVAEAARQGLHRSWLAALLDRLAQFVDGHRDEIREKFAAHSSRWLPSWVDGKLADLTGDSLVALLMALQDPDHRWRQRLDQLLIALPDLLAASHAWQVEAAALQSRLWTRPGGAGGGLAERLRGLGRRLAADPAWQATLQDWLERIAHKVLLPRRQTIGDFVARLVAGWDDADLIAKLEAEVGADLHYIRLNGTIVGGLVGLILFAVTRWLG